MPIEWMQNINLIARIAKANAPSQPKRKDQQPRVNYTAEDVQSSSKSSRTPTTDKEPLTFIKHPKMVKNPVCLPFKSTLFTQGIENEHE